MKYFVLVVAVFLGSIFMGSTSRANMNLRAPASSGTFNCRVADHGAAEIVVNANGLLNAGRFGNYFIDDRLARKLITGEIQTEKSQVRAEARDFNTLKYSMPGAITAWFSGYTFISRKVKVRLLVETSGNRVDLTDCVLR